MTPRRAVDCPDSRVVEPAVARSREGKNGLRLWLSQPFTKRLLGLVAFGVVLRLAAVYDVRTQPVSDFWSYYQRALNLYDQWCYDVFPGVPDASYPPAYPILLAAAFVLVPTSHTLALAKLVNCLLGGLTIFIGGQLARRFWGHRAGLLAALLAAIYPRYLLMPCILASENLFAPLLLLFIYLSLQACRRSRSPRAAVLGGAALGLLALTRTVAYYFGCLWLLGAIASRKRWRVILLEMTLLLGVQHAVMLPWAIRNSVAIGRFTFLTTTGGINLFIGNNPHASGGWYDWGADLERVAPGILRKGSVAIDDAARAAALAWMRDHPAQATLLYFKKLHMIVMDDAIIAGWAISGQRITPPPEGRDVLPGPHFLKEHHFAVLRTLRISAWTLTLLGAAGVVMLFRRALQSRSATEWTCAITFFAAAAYVPALSALILANGRYRWPPEDVCVPLAGLLLDWGVSWVAAAQSTRSLGAFP